MVLKIPPPPQFSGPQWPLFNRWLLELQGILSNSGGIDPATVQGLTQTEAQVVQNTTNIVNLQSGQGGQGNQILVIEGEVTAINGEIATINGQITSLSARNQVLNGAVDPANGLGNVGDWYANTAGAAGHRIFVKTGAATWFAFPF